LDENNKLKFFEDNCDESGVANKCKRGRFKSDGIYYHAYGYIHFFGLPKGWWILFTDKRSPSWLTEIAALCYYWVQRRGSALRLAYLLVLRWFCSEQLSPSGLS